MTLPGIEYGSFEIGPIRPPSEAYSLLLRVTRNCPWNKCQFCNLYKGQKFEVRPVDDVKHDIVLAKGIYDSIVQWSTGSGSNLKEIAVSVFHSRQDDPSIRDIALWMWAGAETVFLQDANTLILKTPDLAEILVFLRQTFPQVNRVTSYGRSKTASKKSRDEMHQLKEAGLSRIHIGLESGCDAVLDMMQKGVTSAEHIEGGKRVREAGISLSEYIMPGLGGRKLSAEHARDTAAVLNDIDPDFIRVRSLHVRQSMPLWEKIESGQFELQSEDEVVEELGILVDQLNVTGELKSDHIMNLLPDIEGKFPEAKAACLGVIGKYLSLLPAERLHYRLGRRAGYYERVEDMEDVFRRSRVEALISKTETDEGGALEKLIYRLKSRMI